MPSALAPVPSAPAHAPVSLGVAGLLAPPPPPVGEADAAPETSDDAGATGDDRPTLLRKRGVPPFWIDREYDTHRTLAMGLPPLFIHRTPKAGHPEKLLHADLALTFGWYSKADERRRWFNPLALFFGGFSERKTVWGSVIALAGYRRVGEQFNFGQFPLVWWWGTKFVKNFLFIPFHYQQKAPDGYRGISALLFWYGHRNLQDADLSNDKSHFVAAPVFWRFRRGLKQFDISPLYIGGYNKLEGLKYRTLVPFFLWQSREFGNRRELWTLGWVRRTDRARGRSTWAVPLALTFSHQERERSIFSATPLVWRTHNRLRGSRALVVGPFARYSDPRQRATIFAPVWWQLEDRKRGRTTILAFPLAVARRGPSSFYLVTWLGGGGRSERGWAAAVPPALTFLGRTEKGTSYQGAAGIFWHVRRPDTPERPGHDTWVLGPAAYGRKDETGVRVGLPPLLSFFRGGGPKRYQVVTPLFWHVREQTPQRDRRTLVLTPFYHHRVRAEGGTQLDGGLAPLAFWGSGARYRYGVVPFALFAHVHDVRARQATTISPLFVRSAGPDHRTLGVAALFWDVKRGESERHSVAFPLYYRRQLEGRTLTLTPIGGRLVSPDGVTTVLGPWVRRRTATRDLRGVAPLVWVDAHRTDEGPLRTVVAAPLFIRRRGPAYDLDMWSPLVWRSNVKAGKPRRGLAIVPFYFRQRQPQGVDVDAGLGWFWSRDARRRTHTLIAGPAFHRLSRKAIDTGVAPLYWWHDSETSRRLIALPTIVHVEDKSKDSHTTIAIPLWFDRQRANGRRTWGAFPFVFGGRRLHNFTRFSLAPPGFFDIFRLQRNSRFTGYVPLAFRYQKCGFRAEDDPGCQYTLWGSFPLFLYGKDGQGRVTHGSLLYYWDRRDIGTRLWTPLFGITNWPQKRLAWYAGPVGVRTTNTHRRVFAFPLYYRRAHRLKDQSLTLVAPPLFISRRREDRRFFEAGLLVWQFRQQHKVSTAVVPPVFFHSHAFAQRRLTWLMPLFLRDDNWAKDEAWTAIGPALYVQRRHGKNLDFVQFPLVWHIERGENQGTFGAFLWWDIRAKGKTFQLVPGAFFRWANRAKATSVVGPGLAWWIKDHDPAGDLHWRALFGLFGGGHQAGRRYISIFGAKIWRGPAPPPKAKKPRRRARFRGDAQTPAPEGKGGENGKRRGSRRSPTRAAPTGARSPAAR